ncbi:MAG: hypothetical protein AAFV51_07220 [Pseudomonadota bacterium]
MGNFEIETLNTSALLIFASGFFLSFFLTALFGLAPARLFAPVLRVVGWPLRLPVAALRFLRVLPRTGGRVRAARGAALSATTALRRRFRHKTETEIALLTPDATNDPQGNDATAYDFREAEKSLKREGFLFRDLQILSGYFPERLTSSMTEAIADDYVKEATTFFSRRVVLGVDRNALYDDAEGAVIVSMFNSTDRRCFYALNEIRKTINGNARRLILLFTALLWGLAAAVAALAPTEPLTALGVAVLTILLMLIWHNAGYQKQQEHNTRELRSFLTRYLGRVSDRYREATGIARGVTVGDETDSKKLSASATKWHKIMMWMPFRTFFIESFVRNVLYQIERNCAYYLYIPPLALIVLFIGGVAAVQGGAVDPAAFSSNPESLAAVAAFLVAALIYVERINKVVIADELSQLDWLGYENLLVSDAMADVVGKYAEDVGFWKRRLDR